MGAYIINEYNKKFDLLFDNLLFFVKTKLTDRFTPNIPREKGKPRKLKNNKKL